MASTRTRLIALALGALWLVPAADAAEDPRIERGKQVYLTQRCALCHAIGGVGNRRSPLDGVGARLTEDEIRRWIVAPQQMNRRVRKKAYDTLPPDQLEALVAYLVSLTTR